MRLEINCDNNVFVAEYLRYGLNILGRIYGMQFAFRTVDVNLMMPDRLWYYLQQHEDPYLFLQPFIKADWGDYFMGLAVTRQHMFHNEVSVIWEMKEILRFTNIKIPGVERKQ